MSLPNLSGVFTALVTPFDAQGAVDIEALKKLIDRQIGASIHGLVPCASTGEGPTLNTSERALIVKTCVERTKGKIPVILGVVTNNTSEAISQHRQALEMGAQATMHAVPSYNKPTQEGLFRHFYEIARSSKLPWILYNNPPRSGIELSLSTIEKLIRECPNLWAIKEANTDPLRAQLLIALSRSIRSDFYILSGEDAFTLPLMAMGGHGVISTTSNVAPVEFVQLYNVIRQGKFDSAQLLANQLAPLISLMFTTTNPLPVKSALTHMELIKAEFRLPMCPLSDDAMDTLKQSLSGLGWLRR